MRQKYPSDISRKQFRSIQSILEKARKKTKPRTVDFCEVFCGVLYVLKSGCQWRMLPEGFPAWQTCYAYWRKWTTTFVNGPSLLEIALKKGGWRRAAKPWPA